MISEELRTKLADRRVIVSVSSGKDSVALSLHLTEQGIEHDRIFLDTRWEHGAVQEHVRYLAERPMRWGMCETAAPERGKQ